MKFNGVRYHSTGLQYIHMIFSETSGFHYMVYNVVTKKPSRFTMHIDQ